MKVGMTGRLLGLLLGLLMAAPPAASFVPQSNGLFNVALPCALTKGSAACAVGGRGLQFHTFLPRGSQSGALQGMKMVGGDGRAPNKPDLPKDFKRVLDGSTDFYQQVGSVDEYDEEEEEDDDDDGDDDDDLPLVIRMDALRRMQSYKAKQTGQTELQSGRISYNEIPLEVDVAEANRRLKKDRAGVDGKKNDIFLLDVRERDEYEFCRLDGSTLIPLSQMKERYDEVPKDKEVLVYCHHGMRSMQVVRYLRTRGWKRVTNVQGGIDEWSLRIDRSVPVY